MINRRRPADNTHRFARWVALIFSFCLPFAARAAEVSAETQAAWEESLQVIRSTVDQHGGALLSTGSGQELKQAGHRVESGFPAANVHGDVETVPSGLIHHWVGTLLIPDAQLIDVVSVLQDYDAYSEIYAPAVVDSKLLSRAPDQFRYRLKFLQKGFGVRVGLVGEFCTKYYQLDPQHGYSVTEATHLAEIQSPGGPEEKIVEGSKSFGYVQKNFIIVRYQQVAEGVVVQVESLTLSRGVNGSVRWLVMPVIKRFSQQTMLVTLERLRSNVQGTRNSAVASTR